MNVGGGEAADQLVRMILSGTEMSVRLSGSALKNLLALTVALAKNNKTISGKVDLARMLRETRDLRQFPMTQEQYAQFAKLAKEHKILFSVIRDKDNHGELVDVILPVTDLDRANMIFSRIAYTPPARQAERSTPQRAQERPQEPQQDRNRAQGHEEQSQTHQPLNEPMRGEFPASRQGAAPPKKDSRSVRDSPDININSSTLSDSERMRRMVEGPTSADRPSIELRLKDFRAQLDQQKKSAPTRTKTRARPKQR